MNQLHWVLLSIAAVLLVALYLYGKWQERKSAQVDESQRISTPRRFNVRCRAARLPRATRAGTGANRTHDGNLG